MRLKSWVLSAAVFAAAVAFGAGTAQAATLTVNTTADNPPSGSECSGVPGDCSLRQAVDKAVDGDTVSVPASGSHYVLGAEIVIDNSITIAGAAANTTIVDATGSTDRVFEVNVPSGSVTISGLTITGGNTTGLGGGINLVNGDLTVADSSVSGNNSGSEGGGIYTDSSGTLTVERTLVANNHAGSHGGGLDLDNGTVNITNTTITNNVTEAQGGGIDRDTDGTVTITNSTITSNTSHDTGDNSGGISDDSTPTVMVNTLFASNTPQDCEQIQNQAGTTNNMDSDGTCFTGPNDKHGNPQLGALADNGGPTQTQALLGSSPAIDAGTSTGCPATDQRGIARPQLGGCDIGAYEYAPGTASAAVPACTNTGAIAVTVTPAQGGFSQAVHYRLDGGAEQRVPTTNNLATVAVAEGRHTLEYWAEGQGGDLELQHHSASVLVDKTAPTVTFRTAHNRHVFRQHQRVSIRIGATDSGSGLSHNPSGTRHLSTRHVGRHTFSVAAIDNCGNRTNARFHYRVTRVAARHRARPPRHVAPRFTG